VKLSALLFYRGRHTEALTLLDGAVRNLEPVVGEHPLLLRALRTRERIMRALDRAESAERIAQRIARIVEPWTP